MPHHPNKSNLYHLAKCIATLLVVIGHATRMHTSVGAIPVMNLSHTLTAVTDYIYAFHMPLFYLLSGCVFGYGIERNKYNDIAAFVKNKLLKLGVPYLVFGLFLVAPTMYAVGLIDSYGDYVFQGILLALNARHLWFLPTLFWIFVIWIFLKPLLVKGWPQLCIAACISFLLSHFSGKFPLSFQILSGCYYQMFFFLGVLFNRYYSSVSAWFYRMRYLLYFLPLALLMVLFYNPNTLTLHTYNLIGITMALFLCWMLLLRFPNILSTRFLTILRQNAFGIYLFHAMIIYALYHLLGQYDLPPLLLSPAIAAASGVLSVFATNLLRKAKLQWALGE